MPKALSPLPFWERAFESGSPSPALGRGWGMRANLQNWDALQDN